MTAELELVTVRLHDLTGDDVGTVDSPAGWTLRRGDTLARRRQGDVRP